MNLHQLSLSPSRLHNVREWVIVYYRNLPHAMNTRIVNRAMRDRQIAGDFDTVGALSKRVNASRSTVSRFLAGRSTSLTVTLTILEALKLTFDQVFMEISPALLARLQTEGMVYDHGGVTVVSAEILRWPEASDFRARFGLPTLSESKAQQTLPAAGQPR